MKTITVNLVDPITTPRGEVTSAILREPTAREYFALGEPFAFASAAQGTTLPMEREDVIADYLGRCLQSPLTLDLVEGSSIANAYRLKEAVLGFFAQARSAATSNAPPTSSSLT